MLWPLIYPGHDASLAELMAARLDGDVVEVGEAFLPADAVETREMRAGSLLGWIRPGLAVTHETAAWVHGALPAAPVSVTVQRASARRPHAIHDHRLRYRDMRLPEQDLIRIAGLAVSTPLRTFMDLVRDRVVRDGEHDCVAVNALLGHDASLVSRAVVALTESGPVPFKRGALTWLHAHRDAVARESGGAF